MKKAKSHTGFPYVSVSFQFLILICYNGFFMTLCLAPEDYTGLTQILTFTASMLSNGVPVTIINDDIVEGNETFFGVLSPQGQPVITNPDTATVLITEDPDDREFS